MLVAALPAAAQARTTGALKHAKVHVVSRHGTKSVRARGSRHRAVTLSRRSGFGRQARVVTASPTITVAQTGFGCGAIGQVTFDTVSWYETYTSGSTTLYSDMLACSGNNGGTTESHTESGPYNCGNYNGAVSDPNSPYEYAAFADGEYALICNNPADNGSGSSNADNSGYNFAAQGFSCQATVGTGSSDNTASNIKNKDSIEFTEDYTDVNNNPASAITTGCMGQLPAKYTVSTSIVAHEVGCSQLNPYGLGYVRGLGVSVTYPDGQYEETCNTPDYNLSASRKGHA
jgi:hypothetical protein